MKKMFFIIVALMMCVFVSCSPSKKELYKTTDYFVESLQTTYESYGLLNIESYTKKTSDGKYQVTPVGRLIIVKISEAVESDVYQDLKEDLERHYKNDDRVNSVFINNGGTITIDCRNTMSYDYEAAEKKNKEIEEKLNEEMENEMERLDFIADSIEKSMKGKNKTQSNYYESDDYYCESDFDYYESDYYDY